MRWLSKVKFRDLLEIYDCNADDEILEIKRILPIWKERFNQYSELKQFIPSLLKIKTEASFNKWLNKVYDYCDLNSIWVDF